MVAQVVQSKATAQNNFGHIPDNGSSISHISVGLGPPDAPQVQRY